MALGSLLAKTQRESFTYWTARERKSPARTSTRLLIRAGIMVILLLSIAVARVHANGAPVDVYLDYIPGTSNWGPRTATGHAVVSVGEGEVTLEVKGLPHLKDEHYQVWLERSDT
ncbi:MAG: hypothetical protein J7M34_03655, partial [Anaerolineae bacterium]|nr:hypothetical protein [Anaerolineae bacterium]